MTSPRGRGRREGSGLISPDNDDPTAEAAFGALVIGGVDRAQVAFWNVIPWWNGTIHVTAPELRAGLAELGRLVELLPDLRGVVLVGVKAARAEEALRARNLATFRSAHPSSQVRAAFPDRWRAIPGVWAEAARACGAIHRAGVGRV